MRLNDSDNKILDTFVTPPISQKIYGQVEGFTVTTFFSKTRAVLIDDRSIQKGWEQMKVTRKLHYLNDNHDTDIPPIGYITSAYLVKNSNFLGIYVKADIIDANAWEKFGKGEYKGFSGGFGGRLMKDSVDTNYKKAVEIVLEKNSYSSEQLNELKADFPGENRVTINEVMRFSEIPSQIININFYINVQYLIQTIQSHPIESGVITVGGMILSSAIDAVVKDFHGFIKKGAKTLFSGKLKPKIVVNNNTLDKDIQIRIEADNPKEMQEAVELFNKTYKKLLEKNKEDLLDAKKILFERKDKKWIIKINF